MRVSRGGEDLGTMSAWQGVYPSFEMLSTRAAIRSTPVEDLYVIFSEVQPDGATAAFRLLVNPLVWWMWLAGPFVVLGTVIALWPASRRTFAYASAPGAPGKDPGRTPELQPATKAPPSWGTTPVYGTCFANS